MNTVALTKLKEQQNLSLESLSEICRLCLRSDSVRFDIFNNEEDYKVPLSQRICEFYRIKVSKNDRLPTKICHHCLFQTEVHTEFREGVMQNEKRLRQFTATVWPETITEDNTQTGETMDSDLTANDIMGDDEEVMDEEREAQMRREIYVQDMKGLECYPGENSLVTVVDPNKDYSSSDEGSEIEEQEQDPEPEIDQESTEMGANVPIVSEALKNIFMCKYCDTAFKSEELCGEHESKSHRPDAPYGCNFCNFSCTFRTSLILHIRDSHRTEKPYICNTCNKGFGRRSDLKKHTIVHTGVRPFACYVCKKNFSRNTNLTKHLRIHSGLKPYVCSRCPRSFTTHTDLIRHQQVHSGVRPFRCSRCPATFTRRDKMIHHERVHLRKIGQIPHTTGDSGLDPESMVIALDPFANINHQLTVETEPPPLVNDDTLPRFSVPDHIQNLDLMFPETVNDVVSYGDLNGSDKRVFMCSKCPKRFINKSSYREHMNKHTGIRCHVCNICSKAFSRKRELDRHSIVHTGFKPFECNTCHKRFGRKDKLVRHERIHMEGKLFACAVCEAAFTRKDSLILHQKIHGKLTLTEEAQHQGLMSQDMAISQPFDPARMLKQIPEFIPPMRWSQEMEPKECGFFQEIQH
ncbi:zinc finger protein 271-like isoform X1 [Phlebotomus papatasi]|uniref:zinc finger protein 271-like isoform X1 n=1 Tax=Phlebotomus papatasi TaxID=29031 RepID=UPI00248350EB|nr:zinc finger protein 271-like isoform X1 [Phlebotomus papatasi]